MVSSPSPKTFSASSNTVLPTFQQAVKTNVVAPMVKCSTASSSEDVNQSVLQSSSLLGSLSLDQMLASNQRLEEVIHQQDRMISAMLGLGSVSGDAASVSSRVGLEGPGQNLGPSSLDPSIVEHLQRHFVPIAQAAPSVQVTPAAAQTVPSRTLAPHPNHYSQANNACTVGQLGAGRGQASDLGDGPLGVGVRFGALSLGTSHSQQGQVQEHGGRLQHEAAFVHPSAVYSSQPPSSIHGPAPLLPSSALQHSPGAVSAFQQQLLHSHIQHMQLLQQQQLQHQMMPQPFSSSGMPLPTPGVHAAIMSRVPPRGVGSLMSPALVLDPGSLVAQGCLVPGMPSSQLFPKAPYAGPSFTPQQLVYANPRPFFNHLGHLTLPAVSDQGDASSSTMGARMRLTQNLNSGVTMPSASTGKRDH